MKHNYEMFKANKHLLSCLLYWLQTNDKQPLLDSGILCCLIYILNSLLSPNEYSPSTSPVHEAGSKIEKSKKLDPTQSRRLEVMPLFWFSS